VVHWHSDVEPSRFKLSLRLLYPHYRIFERALLEGADSILVTSRAYLDASKPLQPWLHKCHVVPLGVDPARLPEFARPRRRAVERRAAAHPRRGRLSYYKGFETLVHAVLGDPPKELVDHRRRRRAPALERCSRRPAIRTTCGCWRADDETVRRYMASCDVLALPSRERTEAFGIVLLEAMRYAKPLSRATSPAAA
jgi:glycosyltransferase involved in cell wall biosynthesis